MTQEIIILLALIFTALLNLAFIVFVFYVLILGVQKGAPFLRSNKHKVKTMFELAAVKPGEIVVDLGSGDGTLLMEAAQKGAHAIGIEINPFLIYFTKWRARRHGLTSNVTAIRHDLHDFHLGGADIVFLYLLTSTNAALKEKLVRELKPNARIISNTFTIEGWEAVQSKNNVHLYQGIQKIRE